MATQEVAHINFMREKFWHRMWYALSNSTLSRHSAGITFSTAIHIFVIFFYLGVAALEKPEVLEIREISFVDLTETPPPEIVKPKAEKVKVEIPKFEIPEKSLDIPRQQPEPVVAQRPIQAQAVIPAVSLAKRMDMKREQAPLKAQPISIAKSANADILKLDVAKGTKDDQKVQLPDAPIKLKKSDQIATKPNAPTQPVQMASAPPGIQLANRSLSLDKEAQVPASQGLFSDAKQSTGSVQPLAPRKSGVSITGALSNRKIVEKFMPTFPDWAKQQGVGASISMQFTVMESGIVKENIIVMRTSGSREWDETVKKTLLRWRFVALETGGRRKDQTGIITFQFVVD